jgi:hypothetical protein
MYTVCVMRHFLISTDIVKCAACWCGVARRPVSSHIPKRKALLLREYSDSAVIKRCDSVGQEQKILTCLMCDVSVSGAGSGRVNLL